MARPKEIKESQRRKKKKKINIQDANHLPYHHDHRRTMKDAGPKAVAVLMAIIAITTLWFLLKAAVHVPLDFDAGA